jgi:hypothetical protein
MMLTGNTKVLEKRKTSFRAILPTKNLTWSDLGSSPVLLCERPASVSLNHDLKD